MPADPLTVVLVAFVVLAALLLAVGWWACRQQAGPSMSPEGRATLDALDERMRRDGD